jgi:pyrroloquinoline-quinone synthase
MDARGVANRLDEAIADRMILEHPFYRAWAEGRLDLGDLSFYAAQYWRQVEAFPGYLEAIADRLPEGDACRIVEANLGDERGGDHPGLWLQFASALGARSDDVRAAEVEPETAQCVESFREATRTASPAFALGMIYGYESQTPAVAKTKVQGLRDHYGIDGAGVEYFDLHGELDVTHAAELAAAIADVEPTGALDEAAAGARAGAGAIWTLLDGVARARHIT